MNSLELLNRSWFLSINAGPATPAGLIAFATFCAQYTIFVIPLTLLGQWFLGGPRGHQRALFSFVTIMIALGLGLICTICWFHPRPFMVPLGHTWIYHAPETSFPSDHATLFFSAGLSLFLAGARVSGGLILLLSLLVAWSRVFLGVHFPLDIAGAALVTVLACLLSGSLRPYVDGKLTSFAENISTRFFSWLPDGFTP
ncbi:undecaprenyl-diphosphatase [Pantoea agglomerans]|uniref:undecaprenyl-diphosphatase n=1 Tax=Enterobacter agglomerans TaxID=549 RepID=UPI0032088663